MPEQEGKVAVVTGGGGGVGRAEALQLARDGAAVVVNDLRGEAAQETAAMIRDAGGRAVASIGDISLWDTGKAMIERALAEFGRLDVLVNNAGNSRPRYIVNMTEEDWDSVIGIHLKGSFVGTKFAAMHWQAESKRLGAPVGGAVIMTTSGNGLHGQPGYINYVAAKSGIAAMTTTLAKEFAPFGVRVNAIAPLAFSGMTTPIWGGAIFPEDKREELSPEQVATVACWLAAPRSAPLTGEVVSFGGQHLRSVAEWPVKGEAAADGLWSYEALDAARGTLFPQAVAP